MCDKNGGRYAKSRSDYGLYCRVCMRVFSDRSDLWREKEKIPQWSTGDCVNNECKLGKCVAGYHAYGNVCERNNVNNCGAHGKACSAQISQWADGDCPDGLCNVSACNSGYHVYGATCEKDSQTNCGKHGNVCTVSWYTFLTGVPSICSNGKCT